MRFLIIILLLLIISCSSYKEEWKLSLIPDPAYLLWKKEKLPCFKNIKKDSLVVGVSILSERRIPQNIYHYGLDTITISSACYYDAILLSINDLTIDSKKMVSYTARYSNILASNIYVKFNMKSFERYILKEFSGRKLALYSVIADNKDPTRAFYLGDYRIENPLFEINRINLKIKPDRYILILHTKNQLTSKNKEYFNTLINSLEKKPEVIFAKIDKKIRVSNTLIYPLSSKEISISSSKRFGFFKIKESEIIYETQATAIPPITKMIKETEEELTKKIFSTSTPLADRELLTLLAKGLVNFLPSDIAIIPHDIINSGIKPGDVYLKDLYAIFKNPEDNLVYIKAKGEDVENICERFEKNAVIYISPKTIKDEKNKFIKGRIYRIITTREFIKNNDAFLNFITEFTVLDTKIKQPIIWYFNKLKKI